MRILYLSQYFFPEVGATQTRAYEMASNWVRLGHHVTLISELPNHPSGIIPPAYRGKLYQNDQLDGIEVIRVWVKASPKKNFPNRILFYLSFMFNAAAAGVFLARGHHDLLYASSPPLFVGASALILSSLKRIPLVFEVRDLWPESAVALGELSNPRFIAWSTRLEEACYRRARKVIVVTSDIRERLIRRGITDEKILLVPNGANTELFQFDPAARERIRASLGLQDKFIAIYAGIHGVAQGLEHVVEAARLLRDEARIHFLLIGEGPKKAEIATLVERYQLNNMTQLPEQPRNDIPAFLSVADVALIPLRKIDIFKGALPSKIFDAWACNRPILLSVDGEARQIMEAAHGGTFVPPEDTEAMAAALITLSRSPHECERMGENGRAYTLQHFSRRALAEQLANELEKLVP
jgi:glycosyltransferase involved in cell wall biosynthesis